MARYPFNYRSEEAKEIIERERRERRGTHPHVIAEARSRDGSCAIRVVEKLDEKAYAVFSPGWEVSRHDRKRLVERANKRLEEAYKRDAEAEKNGEIATTVSSLQHMAAISGSWLEPVSYPRRFSSTKDSGSAQKLESYYFILDGKMDDGIHDPAGWRDYRLKCKGHEAISLGELYDAVSTYRGKKIRLSLESYA